jgi:hypothetical protein
MIAWLFIWVGPSTVLRQPNDLSSVELKCRERSDCLGYVNNRSASAAVACDHARVSLIVCKKVD